MIETAAQVSNESHLDSALAYADLGWPVFPLHSMVDGQCTCGNPKCSSPGKHPRTKHGYKEGTTKLQQINSWWTSYPRANIGVVTGAASGAFVLDVDPDKGGKESLAKLKAEYGELPETVEQTTGGGGWHLFFGFVEGITNSAGSLGPGLDIRGTGGYVVVPPSQTTAKYQWRDGRGPRESKPAEAPTWLVKKLTKSGNIEVFPLKSSHFIYEGTRNTTLTSLAGTMQRRGMSREAIVVALQKENSHRCRPPLSETEVATIAKSVSQYHSETKHPPTDLGNAERLRARHGHDMRYCAAWGKWLTWDGRRFRLDAVEAVRLRAMETAKAIYEEVTLEDDPHRSRQLSNWAQTSQAKFRLDAMLSVAQPMLAIQPEDLDQDTMLLNVENGTLDLRTGELRPHDRGDLITKLAPVTYDPDAGCPIWDQFVDRITGGRAELKAYIQRAAGYTLTGDISEHCLFVQFGIGRNGKTTFDETLLALLGDYARKTEARTFLHCRQEGVRNDVAGLKGVRLVTAAEVGRGRRLNESLVKELTGGDTVSARFLYGEYFQYRPEFKIYLACNNKPEIHGQDIGTWSRIRVIPFDVVIPEAKQDKQLPAKLRLELPGILNWALQGCLQWQESGLQEPAEVTQATTDYRCEADHVGNFLSECCLTTGDKAGSASKPRIAASDLYRRYIEWVEDAVADPLTKNAFGATMAEHGYRSRSLQWHGKKRRVYEGLKLRETKAE